MSTHFFDITFAEEGPEFAGRFEVEDPLDDALQAAGVGEVTGGGSGLHGSSVDVDATTKVVPAGRVSSATTLVATAEVWFCTTKL